MAYQRAARRMPGLELLAKAQRSWARRKQIAEDKAMRQRSRLILETLEPRILMAADPLSFVADPTVAQDLSIAIVDKLGVPTIQMMETATSKIVLEQAVSKTSRLDITLSNLNDKITIKSDFTGVIPVTIAGGTGADTIVGQTGAGLTYSIERAAGGSVAGITFDAVEKLKGQDTVNDVFVLKPGGTMSGGLDGGVGGTDSFRGSGQALTFTVNAANGGTAGGVGFIGIETLRGADGFNDTFAFSAGGSIASINGGSGDSDSLVNQTGVGLTVSIDRANGGSVAGLSFDGIENLRGADGVSDVFVLKAGGSLGGTIEGGLGGTDSLEGNGRALTFSIDKANGGAVAGIAFSGIETLRGADGFNDTFEMLPGGSISGGINGGSGDSDVLASKTGLGRTFTIDRANGGTLGALVYDGIENLRGEANLNDTFSLKAGGSLGGAVDGGAGGMDSLRLTGAAAVGTVKYDATAADSGRITIDGLGLNFKGLEPIDDQLTAATRLITATSGDDAVSVTQDALGKITVSGASFEKISFKAPTLSLVVDGGAGTDTVSIDSNLKMAGIALTLAGETISVANRTVNLQGGSGKGNLTFTSIGQVAAPGGTVDGVSGTLAKTAALIDIKGSTISAAAISLSALASYTKSVTATSIAALGVDAAATVDIGTSTLKASTTLDISAATNVTLTTKAAVSAGAGSGATDAVIAVTLLKSATAVKIADTTLASTGAMKLGALTKAVITTTADARGNAAKTGAASANTVVTAKTDLAITGISKLSSASTMALASGSQLTVTTNAFGSAGGVSGATPRAGTLLTRSNARTPDGTVGVAASVAVNAIDSTNNTLLDGTLAASATGGLTVDSAGSHTVSALADSGASTTSTGFAAGVAINSVSEASTTVLRGAATFTGPSIAFNAGEVSTVTASAISGVGSTGGSSLAGSLAINDVSADASATLAAGSSLDLNNAKLTIGSSDTASATASAKADVDSGGKAAGIGASVALNFSDNDLVTTLAGSLADAGAVTLKNVAINALITTATNGAAGGVAVTPVFALSSSGNDSRVSVDTGPALAATSLTLDNASAESRKTTADASLTATKAAVGAAIALSLGAPSVVTRLDRTATISGAVTLSGRFRADNDTKATASVGGDGGKGGNATAQTGKGVAFDNARSGRSNTAPKADTSSGAFGAAAAIAYDGDGGAVQTLVDVNGKLTATGAVTIEALHDLDVATIADGSVVKGGASVGVGAAVAINSLTLKTSALERGTVVAGAGITLRAAGLPTDTSSASKDVVSAKAIAGAGATTFGLAGALALNVLDLDSTAEAIGGSSLAGGTGLILLQATSATDATTIATSNAAAGSGGSGVGVGIGVALAILDSDALAQVDGTALVTGNGGLSLKAQGTHAAHGKAEAGAVSGSVSVAPSTYIVVSKNDTLANLPDGADLTLKGQVLVEAKHAVTVDGTSGASGTGASAGIGLSLTLGLVSDTAQALVSRSLTTDWSVTVRAQNAVDVTLATVASSAGGKAEGAQSTSNDQVKKELDFANAKKGGTAATSPYASTSSGQFGLAAALSLSIVNGQALAEVAAGKTVTTGSTLTIEALSDVDSSTSADGSVVKAGAVGVGAALAANALSLQTSALLLGTAAAANGTTLRAGGVAADVSSPGKSVIAAKAVAGAGATNVGIAGALGLNVIDLDATARAAAGSLLSGGAKLLSATSATDVTTIATSDAKAGAGGAGASGVGIGVGVAVAILDSDATAEVEGGAGVTGTGGLSLQAAGTHAAHGKAEAGAVSGSVSVAPSTYIVVSKNDTLANLPDGPDLTLKGQVLLEAKHAVTIDGTSGASGTGANAGIGLSMTLGLVSDTAQALVSRSLTTDWSVTVRAQNAVDVTLATVASSAGGKAQGAQSTTNDQVKKELDFANAKKGGTAATSPYASTSSGQFGLAAALSLSIVNGQALAEVAAGKTVTTGTTVTIEALDDVDSAVTADGSVVKGGASVGVGAAVALNALSLKTSALVRGTVVAGSGITLRAAGLPTDASSANKDVVSAKAIAGSGATTFGLAGALALNVVNLDSLARAEAGSSLSGGTGLILLNAASLTDTTTIATSNAAAGSGGSGVGVGVGAALALLDSDALAEIDGTALVTGNGGLSLTAQGGHAAHGKAEAGAVSGAVSVAPSVYIVAASNDTAANLPDGAALTLKGAVLLEAKHAMTVDGTSGASGTGASAGIGISLTLGLVTDTAQAVVTRSLTTDGAVTLRAVNAVDVALVSTASSAGGKADGAQTKSDDQVKKELDFANAKKGGTAATAPKADTSSGGFGLAAAIALSIVNGRALAQVSAGKTVTTTGLVTLEALADVDSAVTADGSVVKGGASVGVGAAVAINALTLKTSALVRGTVVAGAGITLRAAGLPTDASSANKDVVSAKAIAGSGATTFGLAGALGLNVLDLDSTAEAIGGSSLSAGTGLILLNAAALTDTTTIATSNAAAGSGGSGVGVGVGVALALLDSDALAQVDGTALVKGNGGLSLTAQGGHAAHGKAEAGAVSGAVSVAPSVFIVAASNDTAANLPDGAALTLKGAVLLEAKHAMAVDGTSGASGTGATAGIGLSLTLGVVTDTAQAVVTRSLTTDGAVTLRAVNLVDVALVSTASSAGGKAEGAQTKSDDQVKKELDFANLKKGGTAATSKSAQAPDANGSGQTVGIAAAISLSIVNASAVALLPVGKSITTAGAVTLETTADVDSSVRADGQTVDGSNPKVGVGVGVAMNVINFKNSASVLGTVTSGGLAIRALTPPAAAETYSDIGATAISGTGAQNVGVAGAFAANFLDINSDAILAGKAVESAAGAVELRAEVRTKPVVAATSNAGAIGEQGGSSGVGVGLSVALNIVDNDATAEVKDGIGLSGGGSLTISAVDANLTKTTAVAGSSAGSVGITPSLALLVAEDQATARLGTGVATNLSGAVTISATNKLTAATKSDASVKGATTAGVGAAVALNIALDAADAGAYRTISAGGTIKVAADLAVGVSAIALASSKGASPKASGEPTTSNGQVSSLTNFGNSQSGAGASAPQVAKTNGGRGSEQSVGVAAALALNVVPGHARAVLPATIDVKSTGGGVGVFSGLDVDARAEADGSTVAKGSVGVGVAVALNVINAENSALLAASTIAKGDVSASATMSAQGDGVDTFAAIANAGAGAKSVGVAGAVAIDLIDIDTSGRITDTVKAGGGSVLVASAVKSDTTTTATSAATGKGGNDQSGVGVGASFALSVLDLDSTALIPDTIAVNGAANFTVKASGVHAARTSAIAGSAGNVSVSPAVALTIATSNTLATLGKGAAADATGAMLIEAVHGGDYDTKADAKAGGADVSVGAAIAVGVVMERGAALLLRDVNAGGDVRIRARNPMSSSVAAYGGAGGNSDSNTDTADSESSNAVNNNSNIKNNADVQALPGGKVDVPKAAPEASDASTTSQSESGGKGSGGVGVAAAIGVNVITTSATATIGAARSISSGGSMEVSSALQVDGSAKAFGTAIKDLQKDTAIGAGVALNVVSASNVATVGKNSTLRAKSGLDVSATMAQRGASDITNDMVVQAAAASGAKKNGVAGSVAIDVVTYDTNASLGTGNDVIVSAGAANITAKAAFTVQNLAGSAAFGSDIGVGAAVVVQSSLITTDAVLDDDGKLDALGGISVVASTSYVPRAEDLKGILTVRLSSGAFGGGASDESTAIGGSVAVNVVNVTTEAIAGERVKLNQRTASTGGVKIAADSLVRLFSGAGGVGVALGDTGIGIGIDVTIVNQSTLARIGGLAAVQAGGDVAVTATSRNQQTVVAGSFGASKQTGGAGSIIVNLYNMGSDPNGARAQTGTDVVIASGGKVSVVAANPSAAETDSLKLIAGSAGVSGETAVGIASVTAIRKDVFEAKVGSRNTITMAKGLDVIARSARSIDMIAAAGAGGVKTGAAGSLTVLTLSETATAQIGLDAVITGNGVADVRVLAEDRTTMTRVAGAAGFGGDNGVGAGLDVGVVTKNTTASIAARSVVTTGGSVEVRAFSKEDLTALAVSAGAGSELAIAGSVDVVVHTIKTRAFIEGTTTGAKTTVKADGNVVVEASAENELDVFAGGLSAASSNAIGASAPVPVLNKTTEAFIGTNAIVEGKGLNGSSDVRSGGFGVTYVDAPKSGTPEVTTTLTKGDGFSLTAKGSADPNKGLPGGTAGVGDATGEKVRKVVPASIKMKGVAVSATGYDDIGLVGISGGASGSIAVNVTGVINVSNIKTSGRIDDGATVNVAGVGGANQSVLVVGSSDYAKLTVSIGLAASGSVAVAPSVAVDAITLSTEAVIGGQAQVFAKDSVAVKARSAEDLKSVVASLAASGSAAIAGSPAILVLNSTTTARIGTLGVADVPAVVKAGGSVIVQATDDTKALSIAGSGGFAGTAGIGAGVGIMVINKDTVARIAGGSTVNAGASTGVAGVNSLGGLDSRFGATVAGLIVEAGSSENLQTYAIAGGVGGTVGVAGGVGVTIVDSDTAATIGNAALINQTGALAAAQGVRVAARNEVSVISVAGGLGGGTVGVAGAIGVGIVRNGTEASVGLGALVKAGGLVTVDATSKQDIVAVAASAALGSFAGAISLGTWVIGGDYNAGGGAASESAFAGAYQSTVTGGAFGGYQGVLGGYKPIAITAASVDTAANTLNLKTTTLRTGDSVVYKPAAGASIGGLVAGQTYYVISTATAEPLQARAQCQRCGGRHRHQSRRRRGGGQFRPRRQCPRGVRPRPGADRPHQRRPDGVADDAADRCRWLRPRHGRHCRAGQGRRRDHRQWRHEGQRQGRSQIHAGRRRGRRRWNRHRRRLCDAGAQEYGAR